MSAGADHAKVGLDVSANEETREHVAYSFCRNVHADTRRKKGVRLHSLRDGQTNRQTDRQRDREIEKEREGETERQLR